MYVPFQREGRHFQKHDDVRRWMLAIQVAGGQAGDASNKGSKVSSVFTDVVVVVVVVVVAVVVFCCCCCCCCCFVFVVLLCLSFCNIFSVLFFCCVVCFCLFVFGWLCWCC